MNIDGVSALVTGGASGLGLATVRRLLDGGAAAVTIADLPTSDGETVAKELGDRVQFAAADVRSPDEVQAAIDAATSRGPLRVLVHCAGRGGAIALGHPLGASGARLMTTMLNALEATGGRYGLQTMCEAGGMANATIIERL